MPRGASHGLRRICFVLLLSVCASLSIVRPASAVEPLSPADTERVLRILGTSRYERVTLPSPWLDQLRETMNSRWATAEQRRQILDFLLRNASTPPHRFPFGRTWGDEYRSMAFDFAPQMTAEQRTRLLELLGNGPLGMDAANRALADAIARARPDELTRRPLADPVRQFYELLEVRAQAADRDSNIAGWVDLAAVDRRIVALQANAAVRDLLLQAQRTAANSQLFSMAEQEAFLTSREFARALSLLDERQAQELLARHIGPLARLDPERARRVLDGIARTAAEMQLGDLPAAQRQARAREALDALILRIDAPGGGLPPDLRDAVDHVKNSADTAAKLAEFISRRAAGHASALNDVTAGMAPEARNRFFRTVSALEARGVLPAAASVAAVAVLGARLANGEYATPRQIIETVGASADVVGAAGSLIERLRGLTGTARVLQRIGVVGGAITTGVDAYSSYDLFRQGRNWEGTSEACAAGAAGVGTVAGACAVFASASWAPPVAFIAAAAYVGFKAIRGWAASADQHALLRRHGVRLRTRGELPPGPPPPPVLQREIPTLGPAYTPPAPCHTPFAPPQIGPQIGRR